MSMQNYGCDQAVLMSVTHHDYPAAASGTIIDTLCRLSGYVASTTNTTLQHPEGT